jgi:hypothetical protein
MGLLSLPVYVWSGSTPDRYLIDVMHQQPSYPVRGVAQVIALTLIECIVLYLIIRPATYHRSWKRAGTGLLLFSPWLFLCGATLMHAPPYLLLHALWLLLLNVILISMLLYSFFATLRTPASRSVSE